MTGAQLLFVTAARSLLLLALGVAGIAKLRDLPGARRAMAAFGVPQRLVAPFSVGIPTLELICAAALIPAPTVRAGTTVAVGLLALFTVAIAIRLVRGEHPECRCFGELSAGPIGWSTLIRNGVLLASGGVLLASPPQAEFLTALNQATTAIRAASTVTLAIGGLLLLIGVQFALSVQLLRQNGRLLLRMDELESRAGGSRAGLPVGAVAPTFSLPSLSGQVVTFGGGASGHRPAALVFTDHRCGPCQQLAETLVSQGSSVREGMRILVITDNDEPANRRRFAKYDADSVLLQRRDEVAAVYDALVTPSIVQVDENGRIAAPLVAGRDHVLRLISRSVPADA